MKFVTVMDMWLLILNGGLLIAILYYGRKLVGSVEKAVSRQDKETVDAAVANENKRVQKIIEKELSIFKNAVAMGDESFKGISEELELILKEVKK